MDRIPVDIYKNDLIVGSDGKHVLIGEQAFCRRGLTTLFSPVLQCSTLYTNITGIWNPIVVWYFNPFANRFEHTTPSPKCSNILEPTAERAIIEYIMFHDYFDEGILIEGLITYLQNNTNLDSLYMEAAFWHLPVDWLDYWLNEAREDCEL